MKNYIYHPYSIGKTGEKVWTDILGYYTSNYRLPTSIARTVIAINRFYKIEESIDISKFSTLNRDASRFIFVFEYTS